MTRKSKSTSGRKTSTTDDSSLIPEPFQIVGAATVTAGDATIKVPSLTIEGEWLRRCGFPIGSAAYLTPDKRGEMTLHRLGLGGVPRRIRIVAVPARKKAGARKPK